MSSLKMIVSERIYTEKGVINGALIIKGKIIEKIIDKSDISADFNGEIYEYGDRMVLPGLIEMHIHGFKGWSAMTPNIQDIRGLAKALPTNGVTGFTPTNHYDKGVFKNNEVISDVMDENREGARILGIHMEGPFISLEKLGSVLPSETTKPNIELMKKYIETSRNNIVTVTLAPELKGATELIDFIVSQNINVCIGHTNATYEEAKKAVDQGAKITQKTGNCMRGMHHREMGVVGLSLLDSRLYNEINSDLAHASKEFLDLFYRVKGHEKICIVADSGVMSGMRKAKYKLPDRGIYHVGPDELLHIEDGTLDGSIHSMLYGLKNWVKELNIPIEEAIIMSSLNPAKVLGREKEKGSIAVGKDADIFISDNDFKVEATFVEGDLEYRKDDGVIYENTEMYDYLIEAYD